MEKSFASLRQLDRHPSGPIRIYPNCEPDDYPAHWHMKYEIILPVRETYGALVDNNRYELVPGDILIIPAGVVHEIFAPEEGMRYIIMVDQDVVYAAEGFTAEELYHWAEDARYFVQGYFTLDSLHWLGQGGRIPPTAANVGGKLDIKPELSYDRTGALTLCGMCRGRKKALRAILQDFRENYGHDRSLPIAIASADADKDADWLEAQIRKEKGCEDVVVMRSYISPVVGSHVGPGMVAVAFWGSDRREKLSLTDRIARKVRGV